MKKFPLLCLFALTCAVPALAQTSYRYDNFDTAAGVRIETVKTTAVLPPSTTVRPVAKPIGPQVIGSTRPTPSLYTAAPRAMSMKSNTTLGPYTTGDARVDTFIVESSVRNGVDPVLLYAQMHTESAFKRGAVSPKGASGLMQLMPATARRFGVTNIFDPQQNIEGGARYMRYLLDYFGGDVSLALAGYNAGEGAVMKYGRRVPPYRETQEYVRRIGLRYSQIRGGARAESPCGDDANRAARPDLPARRLRRPPPRRPPPTRHAVKGIRN